MLKEAKSTHTCYRSTALTCTSSSTKQITDRARSTSSRAAARTARLAQLKVENLAVQESLAKIRLELSVIQQAAQVKKEQDYREYQDAHQKLQLQIESCDEKYRLMEESIIAGSCTERRSMTSHLGSRGKEDDCRVGLCEIECSTKEPTEEFSNVSQGNNTRPISGSGAGVDGKTQPSSKGDPDDAAGSFRAGAGEESTLAEGEHRAHPETDSIPTIPTSTKESILEVQHSTDLIDLSMGTLECHIEISQKDRDVGATMPGATANDRDSVSDARTRLVASTCKDVSDEHHARERPQPAERSSRWLGTVESKTQVGILGQRWEQETNSIRWRNQTLREPRKPASRKEVPGTESRSQKEKQFNYSQLITKAVFDLFDDSNQCILFDSTFITIDWWIEQSGAANIGSWFSSLKKKTHVELNRRSETTVRFSARQQVMHGVMAWKFDQPDKLIDIGMTQQNLDDLRDTAKRESHQRNSAVVNMGEEALIHTRRTEAVLDCSQPDILTVWVISAPEERRNCSTFVSPAGMLIATGNDGTLRSTLMIEMVLRTVTEAEEAVTENARSSHRLVREGQGRHLVWIDAGHRTLSTLVVKEAEQRVPPEPPDRSALRVGDPRHFVAASSLGKIGRIWKSFNEIKICNVSTMVIHAVEGKLGIINGAMSRSLFYQSGRSAWAHHRASWTRWREHIMKNLRNHRLPWKTGGKTLSDSSDLLYGSGKCYDRILRCHGRFQTLRTPRRRWVWTR